MAPRGGIKLNSLMRGLAANRLLNSNRLVHRAGAYTASSRRIRTDLWHGGECQCTGGLCRSLAETGRKAAPVSTRFVFTATRPNPMNRPSHCNRWGLLQNKAEVDPPASRFKQRSSTILGASWGYGRWAEFCSPWLAPCTGKTPKRGEPSEWGRQGGMPTAPSPGALLAARQSKGVECSWCDAVAAAVTKFRHRIGELGVSGRTAATKAPRSKPLHGELNPEQTSRAAQVFPARIAQYAAQGLLPRPTPGDEALAACARACRHQKLKAQSLESPHHQAPWDSARRTNPRLLPWRPHGIW